MHEWKLWEVFARSQNGVAHRHVGSVQASDAAMALQHARDVFTRRGEFVSLWLVAAEDLVSSGEVERAPWFETAADKGFRHATYYEVPEGVQHL
ncbi:MULTISPECIES: 1,2-phenylacetyl-CoA epoxidase subunit PaaB [Chromobacterium]|uniref:1,2-phenylacetyl-CoA epoxidase subunit B n=3 Tax=Chromobacterium TaxID=535 RepID=A0ABS3GQR5_9NEIS|nr:MULTISPECIES: 1,2-phenylacetyl-CoA epoxidase subunit PaaB [Chromobacterium]AXT44726.1 1,2-phenylacetyl-CoA epoxidase subunit B [Chromobacterium rhizoryzae]KMN76210.1 phenylacetate-CoA oxygenase [Chromobacterium sp. LK11]MBK0416272.1 1,2-phenylacetyl-CoA epoxidase subunit B [Chromobacterium haemolyticum]MBN3006209.1 1,2-phenylacetyl-CoA epoxidase subunit B [Chromobacterium alkanivorans]MBO0417393.1 1,2-phenylacetyl-CoA epoxidase subunit B [Chromobacterium haemolyticum]